MVLLGQVNKFLVPLAIPLLLLDADLRRVSEESRDRRRQLDGSS